MTDDLRIDITNRDLRAARSAWVEAITQGAPTPRVCQLYGDFLHLGATQQQQITEDPGRGR